MERIKAVRTVTVALIAWVLLATAFLLSVRSSIYIIITPFLEFP